VQDWPYGKSVNRCQRCGAEFVYPASNGNGAECPGCGSADLVAQ